MTAFRRAPTRLAVTVLLVTVVTACGRLREGEGPASSDQESFDIVATCGGVTFPTLPPDPSAFEPFTSWDDVDLSRIGAESGFFEAYEWSVAEETAAVLQLFGVPSEAGGGDTPYASAGFAREGGAWMPQGWGDCRIELGAPGWGNAHFVLDPSQTRHPDATRISILATEVNCASGEAPSGRDVRTMILDDTRDSLAIVVLVEPIDGAATCQGNPAFPLEVDLGSPLGDRTIVDASVYPPEERPFATEPTVTGPTGEPAPGTTPPGTPTGPTHPEPERGVPLGESEDRIPILLAVLTSLVDDDGVPLYVNRELCLDDFAQRDCPERLTEEEQAAIAGAFPNRQVRFIDGTDVGDDRVTEGRAQVAWLGPPMVADGRIQVQGGEVCGGLCGHGSVWVVEEIDGAWEVTGTAPGYGSWIA